MRLKALDGLRGVAILLVIFNHIPLKIWYDLSPKWSHIFLDFFLVNGKVGVSILFLLTGFLMAWLYPRLKTNIGFWTKRYARLFPAFLVMVAAWTIIKINPNIPIWGQILVVLGCGGVARGLWQLELILSKKIPVGKILTYFWMFFQIGVALWYVFYLLKIPSPIFYQTWDKNLQWIITGIINATLTLPFGNYIGQLDGVYWSLITETLFYILYPILFLPILSYINQKKSVKWKMLLGGVSFLFIYSLYLISKRILGMEMMIPYLMIYFVAGAVIGSNFDWWQKLFRGKLKIFLKPVGSIGLFLLMLGGVFIYPVIAKTWHPWVQMLIVIPMSMVIIGATLENSWMGKKLENKFLVFLGKYSYALYLTHALIIELAVEIIQPINIVSSFELILISVVGSIGLAWCLYHLIEAPYYRLPKVNLNWEKEENKKDIEKRFYKTMGIFGGVMFFGLIVAFRPPLSWLTYVYFHKNREFVAEENNLGMITANIKPIKKADEKSNLVISLINNEKIISTSKFDINSMVESNYYPFGFPIQTNSKGQNYKINYEIEPKNTVNEIEINNKESELNSVYFVNKNDLKNPKIFLKWIFLKIREPLVNPFFWVGFVGMLPLFLVLLFKKNKL